MNEGRSCSVGGFRIGNCGFAAGGLNHKRWNESDLKKKKQALLIFSCQSSVFLGLDVLVGCGVFWGGGGDSNVSRIPKML